MSKFDVYAIGNAVIDYEIQIDDEFLRTQEVEKGLMTLVDEDRQRVLREAMGDHITKKQAGGSAANSIVSMAQFGGKGFYSCKVANDEDGAFFIEDLKQNGIESNLKFEALEAGTTGKCLVMITPDANRTMNTYLGITTDISVSEINQEALAQSEYLFIEGYLISSDTGRVAMREAKELAKANGVKTSITFSDPAMVKYFGDQMKELMEDGFDLLFCNEEEASLFTGKEDIKEAREELKKVAKFFAITQGENGAIIWDGDTYIDIEPYPVEAVDTTGAGDMFSGAFLYAITQGHSFAQAGKLASMASSKVVSQFGPRLELAQTQEVLKNLH
ncbi:MAG: adenosine kinase [Cytophagales bacterium]|nr:adenosine kinase [Cytophagales bacterium]